MDTPTFLFNEDCLHSNSLFKYISCSVRRNDAEKLTAADKKNILYLLKASSTAARPKDIPYGMAERST
jgi:hypothetical protein